MFLNSTHAETVALIDMHNFALRVEKFVSNPFSRFRVVYCEWGQIFDLNL
jgi:hypothetical protein